MTTPGDTRVAVVTGAGSGIGAATAYELAASGYHVALLGRSRNVSACADALTSQSLSARDYQCDVTDTAAVQRTVDAVARKSGRIDAVVASAGIEVLGAVDQLAEEDWLRALDINLSGVFRIAKATVPYLLQSRGAFVAVASDGGVTGAQGYAAYAASKHGVVGLIRCMALDYGPRGVRSNVICPSFVETPMADRIFEESGPGELEFFKAAVPLGRFAQAEEIARAIRHLLSDDASYTNGLVYNIDGGSTAGYFMGDTPPLT